ncbi:hypothetical protein IJ135_00880 [Candidatus Saccharibacteria bacterium]|nr:hypothetical protein [Candidatus Saccharibacteria bacterium]
MIKLNTAKKCGVVFEQNIRPAPYDHEVRAAWTLAQFYNTELLFLRRRDIDSSPDFMMFGIVWELKSPIGDGKRTIANNLRTAKGQSKNIILDLFRCKMHDYRAIAKARDYINKEVNDIKRLKIIKKSGEVIDIL